MTKVICDRNERNEGFIKAAEPLMKWISENIHPHARVIVDSTRAELLEGLVSHSSYEFVGGKSFRRPYH